MRPLDQPYHPAQLHSTKRMHDVVPVEYLAGFAASFRIAGAARARRCLVAVRIRRLTGGMGRSTRLFLITYISGFSGVAGLDTFIRIILHLLIRLHLLAGLC
jgi:hypothetical protein